jgi:hypothetical protein
MCFDLLEITIGRSKSMMPYQRRQLIYRDQKRDGINKSEQAENNEARQTVLIAAAPEQLE